MDGVGLGVAPESRGGGGQQRALVPASRTLLTPADTTLRASTSRPESVSSRIATFGLSRPSWSTSKRFFSPPENPSLTERSLNDASMLRSSNALLRSFTHVRSLG